MAKRDYYDVLGVNKSATPDQIKSAYRKLAVKHHPDKNKGDKAAEEKFKEASEAYHVLSNSERKQSYDSFGHAARDMVKVLRAWGYEASRKIKTNMQRMAPQVSQRQRRCQRRWR